MSSRSAHIKPLGVASDNRPDMVCVGVVVGAMGVRGAVRLKPFTANVSSIGDYGPLTTFDGATDAPRKFDVTLMHNIKGGVAARFGGIDDRDQAEALKGTKLYIERTALPEIAQEDGFYFEDLEGLEVRDVDGEKFGVIDGVYNFGAGDIIEVALEKGKMMYPFSDEIVPEVNIDAGYVVVNRAEVASEE